MTSTFLMALAFLLWGGALWGLASCGHDIRRAIAFLFVAFSAVAFGFLAMAGDGMPRSILFALVSLFVAADVALAGLGVAQAEPDTDAGRDETWKD